MGEAGIRLPRDTRVFWELTVRGHWIPGSVPFDAWSSAYGPSVPLDVNLSYASLTTSLGVRF
ncbi:MAG TPA: hypothetical protein VFQ22_04820 [Longimicrobiales bacterium]|nr:hypothetical protein [Longimicrobiales bacterium]